MELGYIGLGNMGGALARRLLREHKMRVFDLRPEIVARFADAGACRRRARKRWRAKATW
jgi:3-hydroxyisobutyrate dehydrogenase